MSFGTLFIIVVMAAVFFVTSIQSLPSAVASHFGAGGIADGFMPRDAYILFMGSVSLGVPLAIGVLLSQTHRLPISLISIPNRLYWLAPERADASRRYLARHGTIFPALLVVFMCFVHWQVIDANQAHPARLAEGPFIAGLVLERVCSETKTNNGVQVTRETRAPDPWRWATEEKSMMRANLFVLLVVALQSHASATEGESQTCPATESVRATPPKDPNADPFGAGPWYINSDRSIWAGWDAIRMKAGGRGNKVLWIRPSGTELVVSARRLDGGAGKFEASIPCCYPTGFQASGLRFSEPGCWEISAKAGDRALTFVTRVGSE